MNELADPSTAEGQAAEAPAESPAPDFELGSGMFESDTASEAPEPEQGQSAVETQETQQPSGAPEDIEELRAGYLRQSDYTRKTQDVAEQRRALETREAEIRQREQAVFERLEQLNRPEPTAQTDNLSALMNDPNLDPQSRAGVMVLQQQAETIQNLESRLTDALQKLEQFGPQLEQTAQVANSISEERMAALQTAASEQLSDAVEKLGSETVKQYGDLIRQNFFPNGDVSSWNPPVNPATGEPISMAQFVAGISGKAGEEVSQAASQARATQRGMKAQAKSPGVSVASDGSAINSKSDALSAIRRLRESQA